VAQLNAEALAALAYTQVIRKGAPAVYGHYLGHPHTLANFERAFYMPKLFDNNAYEQWVADGSKDITARALERARQMLKDYEEPALDPARDEELRDYIARRECEIPAADALNEEF
jgi:trimethylamine--corrinoid protein Co-methyltransferase